MNWYSGDIAQAVAESRQKNAIFVVYVAGNDPSTERMTGLINQERIRSQLESENFVAIRIESDSQSYMQFASIYQMVPVPSIFFIGKSGVPIEIGTSMLESIEELDEKIKKVLSSQGMSSSSSASSSFIAAEKISADQEQSAPPVEDSKQEESQENEMEETQIAGEPSSLESRKSAGNAAATAEIIENVNQQEEVVCEGGVCYKKPTEAAVAAAAASSNQHDSEKDENLTKEPNESAESPDLNSRLEATRKLLEQKRRERIEEEKIQEKEREIRRRREGREMQHLQEWQREQELKELKDNIRRERLEEQAARERIRAQIAADRAERAQKFAVVTADGAATAAKQAAQTTPNAKAADSVRLQFRLPNGDVHTHTFEPSTSIVLLRDYVSCTLLAGTGITEFVLATAYPKYEFTPNDDQKTLLQMGLFPSAVILVITKASSKPTAIIARSGGIINMMSSIFWTMMAPVFSVLEYLRNFVSGGRNTGGADGAQKRANEDAQTNNEASKRRNLERFMTGPSTSRVADEFQAHDDRNEQSTHEQQKPYRRYGSSNVHRLSDKRKDSDDENATWNGNSTQQQ